MSGGEDLVKEAGALALSELKGKGGGKKGILQAKVSAMNDDSRFEVIQSLVKLVGGQS